MARPWIKLWTEIRHDPKLSNLTNEQFGILVKLFIIADEIGKNGLIPGHAARGGYSREDLAAELKTTPLILNRLVRNLSRKSTDQNAQPPICQCERSGDIFFTNYEKRQKKPPSAEREAVAERVQRHRASETQL